MNDLYGKQIKPLDRVRAATAEELESQGRTDDPVVLSPAEKIALPAHSPNPGSCNVLLVDEVAVIALTGQTGRLAFALTINPPVPASAPGHRLVKIKEK